MDDLEIQAARIHERLTRTWRDNRHTLYGILRDLHPECHEQREYVSWQIHWYRDAIKRLNDPFNHDVHYIVEYADNREWQAKLLAA